MGASRNFARFEGIQIASASPNSLLERCLWSTAQAAETVGFNEQCFS